MEDDNFMMENQYQYENTYITSPEGYGEGQKFQRGVVSKVVQKIITDKLTGMSYDSTKASQIGKELSDMIKEKVKTMGFPRYKLIVQVTVGQRAGQCLRLATRCLWDTAADNSCSACFENESMFCVAMVFGLYYE
mmetsp:Transcript_32321/g.62141  ORF Transcript_32321/g.62141 Transcript_32321/m.62141 type:complete len:135 (-) Transcript_32321:277-681(-)|eukprot:CAMPEP_0114244610 /NCGR_PEP_ID=MMETSP0058-20121206/11434_1 /TAXON_ID=36894 /ORGANISM="Pyramimonas parkeae, CCMP726" /LENGTH=134 /DNA_ID=CAMNT_0001357567 /DNA_START=416 /DNA_END=820 /DNA_ORIENTATION=-